MKHIKYYSLICMLLSLSHIYGQKLVSANFKENFESIETKSIDTSRLRINYLLEFKEKEKVKAQIDLILLIGEKYSSFLSPHLIVRDSLQNMYAKEIPTVDKFNLILAEFMKAKVKKRIYKNYPENAITVQNPIYVYNYEYIDEVLDLKWKLSKGSKTIIGYDCKSATTTFRGRRYTVWYTNEIPISDGPYLFRGLPGLILEVEVMTGDFRFIATGIDKKKQDIYILSNPNIKKTDRASFRRAEKSFHLNPGIYMQGDTYSAPGKIEDTSKYPPIPYNPIELE